MFEAILAARERLEGQAHRTPVMTSRTLDERVGAAVHLKCENFQRMGAFKFRGAFNAVARIPVGDRPRGVVTFSSGNHAQAVALVGRMLDIPTTVIMPRDAPRIKRQATEGYGAEVRRYDPATTDRETLAREIQAQQGGIMIPPYDHPDVIAGQGTATLELHAQVGDLDLLLVPCGGGGLLSGSAVAARGLMPGCRVVGVEPELADDAARSFRTGVRQTVHNPPTIADGTRTPSLGRLTFPLIQDHVDDFATVSEAAIREAVRFLFYRLKLVVEPSGALGVAALLSGALKPRGRVGIILSGGNIDGPTMAKILQDEAD
ncbi:MAG: threo-3-hydroxy-L-aspartate ammonia-lyase [Desulfobacterales bacterium]|nr:threo-3-hydroxy-L-aspartate ammonia-lyase [Desulfobacterales bacterium]MDJ0856063.1 threo-3-hydroxy-L-aspartate ammonia-lyase [Desulfobacterales bacterium]